MNRRERSFILICVVGILLLILSCIPKSNTMNQTQPMPSSGCSQCHKALSETLPQNHVNIMTQDIKYCTMCHILENEVDPTAITSYTVLHNSDSKVTLHINTTQPVPVFTINASNTSPISLEIFDVSGRLVWNKETVGACKNTVWWEDSYRHAGKMLIATVSTAYNAKITKRFMLVQ